MDLAVPFSRTNPATKCHQMDGDVKLYGDDKPTNDGWNVCSKGRFGYESKPWYPSEPQITGKWMFIPPNIARLVLIHPHLRKGWPEVVQQPPQRFDGLAKVRADGIPGDIEHGRFQYLWNYGSLKIVVSKILWLSKTGRLPGVDVPPSWFRSLMKIKLMLLPHSTYWS